VWCDGERAEGDGIELHDDGREHTVRVVLG
jgi:hypothetical protein